MKCPKCPECDAITNQDMRAWTEEWIKYRCGHCKETYKVEKTETDEAKLMDEEELDESDFQHMVQQQENEEVLSGREPEPKETEDSDGSEQSITEEES